MDVFVFTCVELEAPTEPAVGAYLKIGAADFEPGACAGFAGARPLEPGTAFGIVDFI